MANAKASSNLQALPTSPSLPQTLPSEEVLDALKMILLGAPLNEVLTTIIRLHYALGGYLEESASRHAEDAESGNHSYTFRNGVKSTSLTKRETGNVMVGHCANPDCRRRLSDKLFVCVGTVKFGCIEERDAFFMGCTNHPAEVGDSPSAC
jgi:hypothetical protein